MGKNFQHKLIKFFSFLSAELVRDLCISVAIVGLFYFFGLSAFFACAPKGSSKKKNSEYVKECVLPAEQVNTLQGNWASLPIKVSFRQGEWGSGEVGAVVSAGNTWNDFFNFSKGTSVFNLSGGNLSNSIQSAPNCSTSNSADGTVLYKRASSWTKGASAVAVTTTCYNTATGGPRAVIFNAIMEFNYVNFFTTSSNRFPDLQTIATHELGHLLGLDHSCGPLGRPNQALPNIACPDPSSDPDNPLFETVMFYTSFFSGSEGEVKRDLHENDQGRANCLY